MGPYWLFFLVPLLGLFSPKRLAPDARLAAWCLIGLFFALAIGLRHEVGGDWGSYLAYLKRAGEMSLQEVLLASDPGYYLVNWLVAQFGGGIYWVNLICGAILMAGVVKFARRQPLPWLALLVAVPYLIIVVGMGYTRQAVALGLVLLALVALGDGRTRTFIGWVLIGAAFHKSAVLLLPVAGLAASRNRWFSMAMGALAALIGGYIFLFDSVDHLWTHYVEADYHSQGGVIRVMMNAVPAALFLLLYRYFRLEEGERRLWWWMAVFALVCIPLVLVSSTATDRVALYLIPVQMFVFARLHTLVRDPLHRSYVVVAVVTYYALVLAVWLAYAAHSQFWLPYQVAWSA
ncbi:EpsG family protein [Alkalilimnicola ehrlichii MLHE-1]|uniref:EpsG family protein n=1 Tax=Alkalilimnicola ehrlichii (strain ATCC BAA-1101 / DSM 17681 / MLHE-1) TaxID=187272 RepID=Q0A657_ALKEH|nr:EpsG family protein [Alkalilimnicola ehrlichii]ABI57680.1 conserved hypothetical protein [Alkalilimnicola ehrlichii MLHE-1]